MDVQFVASVAPIVRDTDAARSFYRDALGLSFEGEGNYMFTHELQGTKHLGCGPCQKRRTPDLATPNDLPTSRPPGQHRVRGP